MPSMNDDDNDSHLGTGLSSLIRLSGVTIPARARFVGETVVSATLYSVTLGLCCGVVGGISAAGPLVPYLVGSSIGYTLGIWHHWSMCKRNTLWYAQQYPTILAHSLRIDRHILVPPAVLQASQEQLQRISTSVEGGVEHSSLLTERLPNDEPLNRISMVPTLEQWIQQGGLGRLTWSLLAAQQCRQDIDALQRQERELIMDQYLKDCNSSRTDEDDG